MTLGMIILLLALPALLVGSAFFSGSETAMFSLTQHQRMRLRQGQTVSARAITVLLAERRALLITLLMGNMLVNVMFFVISSELVIQSSKLGLLSTWGLTAATIVPLLVVILFGEVLPKLLAARLTLGCASLTAPLLLLVHRVLTPVRVAAQAAVITPLARLISPGRPEPLSVQELDALLDLSRKRGVIEADEERVLQQALDLREMKVTSLMTPRVDVVAHDLDDPPEALMQLLKQRRPRVLPAYRGDMDRIEGVIYARQALLRPPGAKPDVEKLVRQVMVVPAQQRADRLLLEMRRSGGTLAVVVDEYGGTAGVVTLQDVVEQLVGAMPANAEDDALSTQREPEIEKLAEGRWRCDAQLSVREWATLFRPVVEDHHQDALDDVSTLGGLVMVLADRLPAAGDAVTIGNLRLTVDAVEHRRVTRVLVEWSDRQSAPQRGEASR